MNGLKELNKKGRGEGAKGIYSMEHRRRNEGGGNIYSVHAGGSPSQK